MAEPVDNGLRRQHEEVVVGPCECHVRLALRIEEERRRRLGADEADERRGGVGDE